MITTTQIPFRFFHASTAAAAQRTTRTSSSSSTITTTTRANSIGQSGKKNKCGGQQKHVSSKAMDENENERGNVAMSARELKRALDEMGVDTSDCFEKRELLKRFEENNEKGKTNERERRGNETTAESSTSSSSSSSSSQSKSKKNEDNNKKTFYEDFVKMVKEKASVDAIVSSFRETANRLEIRYGVGAKTNEIVASMRKSVIDFDKNVGLTKFVKKSWPAARDAYQKGRKTPAGQIVNFVFWIWLFSSGIFWTLLYSIGLLAFVVNLLFPQFIAGKVEKMQAEARKRMEDMQRNQQYGGGRQGPGGMGGQQPGSRRTSSSSSSSSSSGRRSYGDDKTIDVDIN